MPSSYCKACRKRDKAHPYWEKKRSYHPHQPHPIVSILQALQNSFVSHLNLQAQNFRLGRQEPCRELIGHESLTQHFDQILHEWLRILIPNNHDHEPNVHNIIHPHEVIW